MPKNTYSKHAHISFLQESSSGPHLSEKIEKTHDEKMECIDLNMNHSLETMGSQISSSLNSLDNKSRLYINGHGSFKHPNYIIDDNGQKLHYRDLAKLIASQLTHESLKDKNSIPHLKISLVMCESAVFGAKLHKELSHYGIYCNVVGRTRVTSISTAPHEQGRKKTIPHDLSKEDYSEISKALHDNTKRFWALQQLRKLGVHHQPGSKVVFFWNDKNDQMMKDAYSGLLKQKVLDIIRKEYDKNEQKIELKNLFDCINDIQNDLNIIETLINLNKDNFDPLFIVRISKLLNDYEEGQKLLSYSITNEKRAALANNEHIFLNRQFQEKLEDEHQYESLLLSFGENTQKTDVYLSKALVLSAVLVLGGALMLKKNSSSSSIFYAFSEQISNLYLTNDDVSTNDNSPDAISDGPEF